MSLIQDEIILPCGVKLKNRIAKAAMSENMASGPNFSNKFEKLYESWAQGGSGLLITGNVMVDKSALGEPHNVIIVKDVNSDWMKIWAKSATQNQTHAWVQLNHPGKQSPKFLSPVTYAPSAIGYTGDLKKTFATPLELTQAQIEDIIKRFAYAAGKVKEYGFTGVQIHGAHGYLISQFLSPNHNQRSDKWGGSLENRMRFLQAIYKAIRETVGDDFPVGVKLNSADFQKGGFSQEESLVVIKELDKFGVDLIEVSGGTYEAPAMVGDKKENHDNSQKTSSTLKREAYFLSFAKLVKKAIDCPLMLTGGFRSKATMELALKQKDIDIVGLARSLAIDPSFPNKLLSEKSEIESEVKKISSGVSALDKLLPLEIIWYTENLHRLGKGKKAMLNLSPWKVIFKTLCSYGIYGLRKMRA